MRRRKKKDEKTGHEVQFNNRLVLTAANLGLLHALLTVAAWCKVLLKAKREQNEKRDERRWPVLVLGILSQPAGASALSACTVQCQGA